MWHVCGTHILLDTLISSLYWSLVLPSFWGFLNDSTHAHMEATTFGHLHTLWGWFRNFTHTLCDGPLPFDVDVTSNVHDNLRPLACNHESKEKGKKNCTIHAIDELCSLRHRWCVKVERPDSRTEKNKVLKLTLPRQKENVKQKLNSHTKALM